MQGFTTKYYLCEAERGDFVVNLQVTTLHTIKTWQIPLRHNSHRADRKLICEHVGVCSVRMCVKGGYEVKENRIAALRGDTAARLDLLRSVANIGEGNDDFEGLIRLQKQLIAIEPDSTRRYSNYNSLAISYYCANQNDSALLALRKATECLYTSADSLL